MLELCESLTDLAKAVENAWSDNRTLKEVFGWNCPPLTRHELADIPLRIAKKIHESNIDEVPDEIEEIISPFTQKVELLKQDTVTYLYNGNANLAVPAYLATLQWLENAIEPIFSWETLLENKALPHQLTRKLRSIRTELDEITPNKEEIKSQIKTINDATNAAESLPTDLQALAEARKRVQEITDNSIKIFGTLEKREKDSQLNEERIRESAEEAKKLVQQCEEAYRITTTKGLAAGFDQRATKLSTSMWVWVGGLVTALCVGAWLGSNRISRLTEALSNPTPHWEIITAQAVLSFLSVGAPLWFAWVSTKQISQRFKLSEDYAFKAAVAKAYEGYRKEAARIDESFEARLFSSALTRLEEAPLRLVEADNHGSPWSELIGSPAFQKALESVPALRDKFIEISKSGIDALTQDRRVPRQNQLPPPD